jgi:predicted RNA-binding protein YlqC (UPF0109 family)
MEELLITIAKALVDNPNEVSVTRVEEEDAIVLSLTVAPDDKGRIIGKQGKIASAIRSIIKSATAQSQKRVIVKIV